MPLNCVYIMIFCNAENIHVSIGCSSDNRHIMLFSTARKKSVSDMGDIVEMSHVWERSRYFASILNKHPHIYWNSVVYIVVSQHADEC